MAYQVELLGFEGPLDLLLQLVEQSRLEVTELSLAEITGQYLSYIGRLSDVDIEELHQFTSLASRLVYIKSLALLPGANIEENEEVIELKRQLDEYGKYQAASSYLQQLFAAGQLSWGRTVKVELALTEQPVGLQVEELSAIFADIMSALPQEAKPLGKAKTISLTEMTGWLSREIEGEPTFNLRGFLLRLNSKVEAAVAFLAVLELVKRGRVAFTQDKHFGDIILSRI